MKALIVLIVACAVFGAAGYFTYELFVKPQVALRAEKAAPPTPAPPDTTIPEFDKCVALRDQGNLMGARAAFQAFIDQYPESTKLDAARDELGDINARIFLTPVQTPDKQVYVVRPGDVITRVAQHNKTTPEFIMRANNLSGIMLRIGQRLLIPPTNFSVVVSRKKNKVTLLNDGHFFKQYAIRKWPTQIPAYKKGGPPLAKLAGMVRDRIAVVDGNRVIYTDKAYPVAIHSIATTIPHCTFYAEAPPSAAQSQATPVPVTGIQLDTNATSEMAALLSHGNPVTVE